MSTAAQSANAVAASRDGLQAALDALVTAVEGHSDVIRKEDAHARAISSIRQDVVRFRDKLAEDRLLRLGVVGQVKAGKSSLLNLLLFGGREVLPKAATPMTASLTHITKSDRDEIEVEYYTKKDWAEIQEHAKEYQRMKAEEDDAPVPDFVSASYELVEMARKRGLQVGQYLDTTAVEAAPVAELNDKLTSLVGATGKLTPLVKSVTIRCGQGVPDLDIVDTPGINDPIGSRSRRAEKMLVDCDAVLLLSYAGQFMDNVDVQFFERRLPQEGVSHRLIIGSKYDSALIDVARDARRDLQRAREETERRLKTHAREAIQRLSDDSEDDPQESAPKPIFISAMCSKLAATPFNQWDRQERSIFDIIRKAYPDYLDAADESAGITAETKAILTELGNQEAVTAHLSQVRHEKEQIIFDSNQKTVDEKRFAADKEITELLKGLRTYRTKINETEAEPINKQLKEVAGLEARLAVMIGDTWHELMEREVKPLSEFRRKLRDEAKEARKKLKGAVEDRTETREKGGVWPWLQRKIGVGGYDTYEERVLNTCDVESVIQEMGEYVNDSFDDLRYKMFTVSTFVGKSHDRLIKIVASQLSNDIAGENHDLDMLRPSLRNAIATVAANARAKLEKQTNFELEELSLESDEVDDGIDQGRKAIKSAIDHAIKWVNQARDDLRRIAEETERSLVPITVDFLTKYQEQLKKDVEDRAFKTDRIDSALLEIEQCRSSLSGLGTPLNAVKEAIN